MFRSIFCSFHGADHYGMPMNEGMTALEMRPWVVPIKYKLDVLRPMKAGETMEWSIVS